MGERGKMSEEVCPRWDFHDLFILDPFSQEVGEVVVFHWPLCCQEEAELSSSTMGTHPPRWATHLAGVMASIFDMLDGK